MNKIMVLGTASSVGKSTVATAICRYYRNKGLKVSPFKAMNISLNSFVTEDGLEMGRSQVVQAEACEIKPLATMNPVLLKPAGNNKTQVIINGKVYCTMDAYKYKELNVKLKKIVKETFDDLSKDYDLMVLEGSGSCAEINLRETDIANMSMAKAADADVILVADIDRGGVFASVAGTLMLLTEEERSRVKGVIINKFRGKVEFFKDAMTQLEDIIKVPVLGILPYFKLDIEDEDSVTDKLKNKSDEAGLDVAVIRLPHMSNFTDFNALDVMENVSIRYVSEVDELKEPDMIIIPGTKNTIYDLKAIKSVGLFDRILELHNKGTIIFGICGGYQILGESVDDLYGVEGEVTIEKGLGLLNIKTIFNEEKNTCQTTGSIECNSEIIKACNGMKVIGYEIHNGVTEILEGSKSFINNNKGEALGVCNIEGNVFGTYLHGVFDEGEFAQSFINAIRKHKGQAIVESEILDYRKYKMSQYDGLAKLFEENIDISRIYNL